MTQQAPPEKPDNKVRDVTPEEMEVSRQGPAIFVNKFFVTGLGANVRITFAEEYQGKSHFRTAVVMATTDINRLRRILDHIASQIVEVKVERKDG